MNVRDSVVSGIVDCTDVSKLKEADLYMEAQQSITTQVFCDFVGVTVNLCYMLQPS